MALKVLRVAGLACACVLMGCAERESDTNALHYLGNPSRTHFVNLTQINVDNVASMRQVWSYDTGDFGTGVSTMVTSPLVVDGVLYGLTPTLNAFAVDAATGAELWRFDAEASSGVQRGLMWWPGEPQARLFYTAGHYLIALHPETGHEIAGFGTAGRLDLRAFVDGGPTRAPSPGVVVDDVIILGLAGNGVSRGGAVIAVDARSGDLRLRFDTLLNGGGADAVVGMAYDVEAKLIFVPTGAPAPEHYGAGRVGDNLYADTLLALDAMTGELRWHYQVVRHGLWGSELTSPPTLVRIRQDGRVVEAVALATRSGSLFLFARDSGETLYSTLEVAAPPSLIAGENAAPVQRTSSVTFTHTQSEFKPPSLEPSLLVPGLGGGVGWGGLAYDATGNRLIFNVQETATVLRLLQVPAGSSDQDEYLRACSRCHGVDRKGIEADRPDRYGAGGPSLVGVGNRLSENEIRSTIQNGRGSMPAVAELGELSRQAIIRYLFANPTSLAEAIPSDEADYVPARLVTLRDADKLPGNQPPWGTLVSIDLDAGEIDWRVPFGEYPAHAGLGAGAENVGGPLLTGSGLVFIGATPDMRLSAYDAANGSLLWQADLDAGGYATPVSYSADGKQYVVIAAGGGLLGPPSGSTYVAFGVPE